MLLNPFQHEQMTQTYHSLPYKVGISLDLKSNLTN